MYFFDENNSSKETNKNQIHRRIQWKLFTLYRNKEKTENKETIFKKNARIIVFVLFDFYLNLDMIY